MGFNSFNKKNFLMAGRPAPGCIDMPEELLFFIGVVFCNLRGYKKGVFRAAQGRGSGKCRLSGWNKFLLTGIN